MYPKKQPRYFKGIFFHIGMISGDIPSLMFVVWEFDGDFTATDFGDDDVVKWVVADGNSLSPDILVCYE